MVMRVFDALLAGAIKAIILTPIYLAIGIVALYILQGGFVNGNVGFTLFVCGVVIWGLETVRYSWRRLAREI